MNNRVLINVIFFVLFAISQTGIATHEVTHIVPKIASSQSDQQDQNQSTTQEHCDHCITKADSDTADIPLNINLSFSHTQHLLATFTVANLISRTPKPYSSRAPPTV